MQVRLFAVARELASADVVAVDVSEPCTIAQVRRALAEKVPALAPILPQVLFAVGCDYVRDDARLVAETEVACIPPVSGG